MSREDLTKWEARYSAPERAPDSPPEAFIVEVASELIGWRKEREPPTAVDVAGGTGRHGRWLAHAGWTTTLVDISPAGLALARAAAPNIRTVAADLDDPIQRANALPAGAFDLVVCAWFLPSEALWAQMVHALRPGGALLYVQPTPRNLERHAKPSARFLFPDGQLEAHFVRIGLEPIRIREGWDERGHYTVRGWAAFR